MAHGVVAATLGPADHGKNPVAHGLQPATLLARGEGHIGFRPFARPVILLAVESGGAEPILQSEIVRVLDAEPSLLGRIHQKQAAERPERLPAEILFAFLIDDDHPPAGIGQFGRGHETRKPRANHDHVRIGRHCLFSPR